MMHLQPANLYRPGRAWHGTTIAIREEDPTGEVAYALAVIRFAGDEIAQASRGCQCRSSRRAQGVLALCSGCGRVSVEREDVGGRG